MSGPVMAAINRIVTSEDLQLLVDAGFMAISQNLLNQADGIFKAVQVMRPDQEAGHLGRAMVRMAASDYNTAIKMLRSGPHTIATRVFLGIAYVRQGDTIAGVEILQKLASIEEDTPFRKLAVETLAELQGTGHGDRIVAPETGCDLP